MTTYFPLVPSNRTAPSFTPTLDGTSYLCQVKWNLFGQRFYLLCTDGANDVIFNVPIVESPRAMDLASAEWDAASLRVFATTTAPHRMKIGSVVNLTMTGTNPDGFNGTFDVNVTSPIAFNYKLGTDPGALVKLGQASFIVSLCKGYFNSTIVYRNGQFEVSP